jgi:hypothetical protein
MGLALVRARFQARMTVRGLKPSRSGALVAGKVTRLETAQVAGSRPSATLSAKRVRLEKAKPLRDRRVGVHDVYGHAHGPRQTHRLKE